MASSSTPSAPAPAPAQLLMYKNRLQEFTSKLGFEYPVYHTVNEGEDHSPKFRSTVYVAEMCYTSRYTFPQKKAAEHDAAMLALEGIIQRTRDEGLSIANQTSPLFKIVMKEYAEQLQIEQPTYNTDLQHLEGVLPVFTASLVFNGTIYTGDHARTKKEAERSAAKAAILSMMGDSSSGTMLVEFIKSKSVFYDAMKGMGLFLSQPSAVLSTTNSGSEDSIDNDSTSEEWNENKKLQSETTPFYTSFPMNQVPPGTAFPMNQVPPFTAAPMSQVPSGTAFPMNQVPPSTAFPMYQVPPFTAAPMSQVPLYTAFPMNQVPPGTTFPMNQVPPYTAFPMSQVPPYTAFPMNQVPPRTAFPMNHVRPFTNATDNSNPTRLRRTRKRLAHRNHFA